VAVGLRFKIVAKDYPIRRSTRIDIAKAIEENCARML